MIQKVHFEEDRIKNDREKIERKLRERRDFFTQKLQAFYS
jgi:hypothetical protein